MTCRFAFFLASAALSICCIGCSHSLRQVPASTSQPHKARFAGTASGIPEELVFYAKELAAIKSRREVGDTSLAPVFGKIVKAADAALQFKPVSVMDKSAVAASGDKHDYLSLARYGWPDPKKPDGLPYVIHDGRRNPETDTIQDKRNLHSVIETTAILATAYHLTGDEKYAGKAAEILRVWFLDPSTRMNPNGNYAQVLRGRSFEGIGIIDFVALAPINEYVSLLEGSKAWTPADEQSMKKWMSDLLDWLMTSGPGLHEAAAQANHGTWYDTQVAALALSIGKDDAARKVLEAAKINRIASQIEPDGRQPRELARTLGLHYSVYNLNALFRLADLGERVGVDLWHFETPDGRSIRKALDWLMPYLADASAWPYKQIEPFDPSHACALLLRAAQKYHDQRYSDLARQLAEGNVRLLVPLFPPTGQN
jgi:alginate lyase